MCFRVFRISSRVADIYVMYYVMACHAISPTCNLNKVVTTEWIQYYYNIEVVVVVVMVVFIRDYFGNLALERINRLAWDNVYPLRINQVNLLIKYLHIPGLSYMQCICLVLMCERIYFNLSTSGGQYFSHNSAARLI